MKGPSHPSPAPSYIVPTFNAEDIGLLSAGYVTFDYVGGELLALNESLGAEIDLLRSTVREHETLLNEERTTEPQKTVKDLELKVRHVEERVDESEAKIRTELTREVSAREADVYELREIVGGEKLARADHHSSVTELIARLNHEHEQRQVLQEEKVNISYVEEQVLTQREILGMLVVQAERADANNARLEEQVLRLRTEKANISYVEEQVTKIYEIVSERDCVFEEQVLVLKMEKANISFVEEQIKESKKQAVRLQVMERNIASIRRPSQSKA